jgi:hypothetical protein
LFLSQQTVDFLRQFNELLWVLLSFSQLTKFSPAILIFLHDGIGSEDALFLAQLFPRYVQFRTALKQAL